ncbi:hypothetical protein LCGC14_2188060 [marine sediment metagenome]|uniref:Uncharacterized protein n=1 Tax=marine sediment metagenome TaxID=412755 RepID=A0A0F9FXR6_9ZZZZ
MLYLRNTTADIKETKWNTWHIGEPLKLSEKPAKVMTFQADGDELTIILEALRKFSRVSKAINALVEIPTDPADG